MHKLTTVGSAILAALLAGNACQANCVRQPAGNFGVPVWRAGTAVGFETQGLAVDADGAPDSYRVDGKGLSYTCDGVFGIRNGVPVTQKTDKAGWQKFCQDAWTKAQQTQDFSQVKIVGFKADCPGPCVQQQGDPLPGEAYITTTSMSVPNTPPNTQRHYVNASAIPYIVLPPTFARQFQLHLGDLVVVYRPKTGATAFAVYAECCDAGEASVKLHQDLQNDPIVVDQDGVKRAKAGIGDRIITVAFPGEHPAAGLDVIAWYMDIQTVGSTALAKWGGEEMLKACAG